MSIDAMANNNDNNIIDHDYLQRPVVALVDDSERNATDEIDDAGVRMSMTDRDNGVIVIADDNDVVDDNETSADAIDEDENEQMADKGSRGGGGSRSRSRSSSSTRSNTNRMSCTSGNTTMRCTCNQGRCDMNSCESDCSCDGGQCRMKGCKDNCSCHGGNCNGASSMYYGAVFSPVIVTIVTSFSFGVVVF